MRKATAIVVGTCLVLLVGTLVTVLPGGLLTVAQSGSTNTTSCCCDKSFAIASHPTMVTAGRGFPISVDGGIQNSRSIWEDTDGRRALVTVECTGGTLEVVWDQPRATSLPTHLAERASLDQGQAITVFAKNVWVFSGQGTATGFYSVTVDVSE